MGRLRETPVHREMEEVGLSTCQCGEGNPKGSDPGDEPEQKQRTGSWADQDSRGFCLVAAMGIRTNRFNSLSLEMTIFASQNYCKNEVTHVPSA